jgi:hypothetical protein
MSATPSICGVIAEFDRPEPMIGALRAARAAGWPDLDASSPHPVPDAAEILGAHGAPVGWIAVGVGLFGAALQFGVQVWLNVFDYPLNVGGRPLFAWPLFLPSAMIVGILWGAVAALVGMLALNRLPRLHHPVFAVPGFERASQDRFFVCLFTGRPGFGPEAAVALLRDHQPLRIAEVPRA